MSLKQLYSDEQLQDMALIDLAHEYLKDKKEPASFDELLKVLKDVRGFTDDEIKAIIAQFYTDLNIDGRFMALGENRWGLHIWYPVDTTEEDVVTHAKSKKKKKAKKVVEDEIDDYIEDEEDLDYEDLDDDVDDDEDDDIDDDDTFEDDLDDDLIDDEDEFDLDEDLDEELEDSDEDFDDDTDEDDEDR